MPWPKGVASRLLLATAAEAATWYPWTLLMIRFLGPGAWPGLLLPVCYLAAAAGWAAHRMVLTPVERRYLAAWGLVLSAGGAGLSTLVARAAPVDLMVRVVVLALAWWRGTTAGLYIQDYRSAYRAMGQDLGALLAAVLLRSFLGLHEAADLFALVVFLVAGLALLAACRMADLTGTWHSFSASPAWWRVTVGASILMVTLTGLGFGLGAAEYRGHLALVQRGLGAVLDRVISLAARVTYPLVAWMMAVLVPFFRRFWEARLHPAGPAAAPDILGLGTESAAGHPVAAVILAGTVTAALLILLFRTLLRTGRSAGTASPHPLEEQRTTTFSWSRLFDRTRQPPAGRDAGSPAVRRVRQLYRRFQAEGRRAGLSRKPCETPRQYRLRLEAEGWPADLLDPITGTYEEVRYGERIPGPEAIARMERAVQALAGRRRFFRLR